MTPGLEPRAYAMPAAYTCPPGAALSRPGIAPASQQPHLRSRAASNCCPWRQLPAMAQQTLCPSQLSSHLWPQVACSCSQCWPSEWQPCPGNFCVSQAATFAPAGPALTCTPSLHPAARRHQLCNARLLDRQASSHPSPHAASTHAAQG